MPRSTLTALALALSLLLAACGTQSGNSPTVQPTNRADAAVATNEVDAALADMATAAPAPTRSHTRPSAVTLESSSPTTAATSSAPATGQPTATTAAATADPANTPTRTAVPAATAAPAPAESIGQVAALPINPDDGQPVPAIPEKWFMVERFNNRADTPRHEFLAIQGSQLGDLAALQAIGIDTAEFVPGSAFVAKVTATDNGKAPWGERAWLADNQATAEFVALRSAIGYKGEHSGHTVIGPDGIEVR